MSQPGRRGTTRGSGAGRWYTLRVQHLDDSSGAIACTNIAMIRVTHRLEAFCRRQVRADAPEEDVQDCWATLLAGMDSVKTS